MLNVPMAIDKEFSLDGAEDALADSARDDTSLDGSDREHEPTETLQGRVVALSLLFPRIVLVDTG